MPGMATVSSRVHEGVPIHDLIHSCVHSDAHTSHVGHTVPGPRKSSENAYCSPYSHQSTHFLGVGLISPGVTTEEETDLPKVSQGMTSCDSVLGLPLQTPCPHLWATGHAGAALTALPHYSPSSSRATPSTRPSSVLVPELISSAISPINISNDKVKEVINEHY